MDGLCLRCSNKVMKTKRYKEYDIVKTVTCIIGNADLTDLTVYECTHFQEKPLCQTPKTES